MSHKPLFTITGIVSHGAGRGRSLGFATANLDLDPALEIPRGVYLSVVSAPNEAERFAVTNVGVHPTVGALPKPFAESHVLDSDVNWYGKKITVKLLFYLREEKCFESVEQLRYQVMRDIEEARTLKEKSV